jgi:anti-anti-sigma factor
MSLSCIEVKEWSEGDPVEGKKAVVFRLSGRLDSGTSDALEERLEGVMKDGVCGCVMELAGVDFMASAGLRVLLGLAKRLTPRGGVVALVAPQPMVLQVLSLSGMVGVLKVCDDLAGARQLVV